MLTDVELWSEMFNRVKYQAIYYFGVFNVSLTGILRKGLKLTRQHIGIICCFRHLEEFQHGMADTENHGTSKANTVNGMTTLNGLNMVRG